VATSWPVTTSPSGGSSITATVINDANNAASQDSDEQGLAGVTVAGDHYAFNLMLLAVGAIMQWLAMIAILVAQNAQGKVQDKQVEHLHQLGVTTHTLVVENTELTEAIHEHLIKMPIGVTSNNGGHTRDVKR